jgi:hypothetical protein
LTFGHGRCAAFCVEKTERIAMTQSLKLHDHVKWKTPQGETSGKIVRVITSHTKLDGHDVAASKDDPHFEVESDKSGKRAVHKGTSLKKAH